MPATPPHTSSIHAPLIQQTIPDWMLSATPARREALKDSATGLPDWYASATPVQRQAVDDACRQSFIAQTVLDQVFATVPDIETFAAPLLAQALKDKGVEADVHSTWLCLKKPLLVSDFRIEVDTFEVLKLSLLQAALHNFEAGECEEGAFHSSSGFLQQAPAETFTATPLSISVSEFMTLCRRLDVGAQYQQHLKDCLQPTEPAAQTRLRDAFIASQKDALRAAAEIALLKQDIRADDYAMLMSVINGQNHPRLGDKQVWFRDLSLMKRRMAGCVVFGICEKYRYSDELILYIPHDPQHPLKRYRSAELRQTFKRLFTERDSTQVPGQPTAYQQFFSRFVAYADRPYYFSQFSRAAADAPTDALHSPWRKIAQELPGIGTFVRIKELPPEPVGKREAEDDPYLDPVDINRPGAAIWADNPDLWGYLYQTHRDRLLADARSHAVPSADADAAARAKKLNHLLEFGMFAVNAVAMFVPVLGEIMMVVMAGQLLKETFEGAIEWGEGDRRAAKAHLIDVAENLALLGAMAGAGKGLAKLMAVKAEPVIEALEPVTRADGQTRLCKPDLRAYQQDIVLDETLEPDAQGLYLIEGRHYVQLDGKVYEAAFDATADEWRIRHPDDRDAWQPLLEHNGHGAWRHELERPLSWSRLQLLRRMGQITYLFGDEQLLNIARISGVEDAVLRRMHVDRLPPPPELADMLQLFEQGRVDEQVERSDPQASLVALLQRQCPGLGRRAAQHLLVNASAEEWGRLQTSRRVPLRLLEQARWHAQQGRFNHALAGLQRQTMAVADSQWLALHALEQLPGWSGNIRLEVRERTVHGRLVDAIGDPASSVRRYLVKTGPDYQAFDQQGLALNSPTESGDHFFASLMHALPDETRKALGVAQRTQSAQLRQRVIDYVSLHRQPLAQALQQRRAGSRSFKPPVRVDARRIGYYASGRGLGMSPSLVTRVRDVYPNLTDQLAEGFILKQLRAGKTEAQIYHLLQLRSRQWRALEATLDEWVGAPLPGTLLQSMIGGKMSTALNLRECWRNAPLADEYSRFGRLDLTCDDPLPALPADFSHVRELNVWGRCVTDANADALLMPFPGLSQLRINATGHEFSNVPLALQRMTELRDLTVSSSIPFAADMPLRLAHLTSLETLRVLSMSHEPLHLSVASLRNLRTLEVVAYSMREFPHGVLELPHLERVILTDTWICSVPRALYDGHERLWRGLSLDWSKFDRASFRPAYEYMKRLPDAPHHAQEMLRNYCRGELRRLLAGVGEPTDLVINGFLQAWPGEAARYQAIEALSEQYQALEQQLDPWVQQALQVWTLLQEGVVRSTVANKIKTNWRRGLHSRYGAPIECATLDVSGAVLQTLPVLPANAFAHVHTLRLNGLKVPAEHLRGFIGGFGEVQRLDLADNALSEIPLPAQSTSRLSQLNLAGNDIGMTEADQQVLGRLQALEYLDLSGNPLRAIDVRGLPELIALNLRGSQVQEWPEGAHTLAQLSWIDLADTRLSSLPEVVLQSDVLLDVNLSGAPLTLETRQALTRVWQRLERERALPAGVLARFADEGAQVSFPPFESGSTIARRLLPLPARPRGDGAATFVARLQRLNRALTGEEADAWIARLRLSASTDQQIGQHIAELELAYETLIQRLNGWLFTRESHGAGWVISADTRSVAAMRIMTCWRDGAFALDAQAEAGQTLSFNGLQIGDLPELPAQFSHVRTLILTGARITAEGCEPFLKVFDHLQHLQLSANDLTELPPVISRMTRLERLDLSSNSLGDPHQLSTVLRHLSHLNWLDLSYNDLQTFDVDGYQALVTLDLHVNNLTQWPDGVLERSSLRTLNLSGNDINALPADALDGEHELLIAGTDLSDNLNLPRDTLLQIQAYREARGLSSVMGISTQELEDMIDSASGHSDGESESFESDEVLPSDGPLSEQKNPWLANVTAEQAARQSVVWDQLAAEPDNAAFFHLLLRLQDTREFQVANADLTRRVWGVLEAIADNSELREVVFASASTHGTCVDGRLLTFSGIESKVFVHNALLQVSPGQSMAKGKALLDLSRQLFRLDRIDALAGKAAVDDLHDEAEVRLGYRIALTGGWSDGLTLPGQPKNMTYSSGVTPGLAAQMRGQVLAAEAGDGFFEDLIQRDYWVDYLKERFPQAFMELDEAETRETTDDEGLRADDPVLLEKMFDLAAARNARMIELSRQEVARIEQGQPRPGPSTRQ